MEKSSTLQTTANGGSDIMLPFVLDLSHQGKLSFSLLRFRVYMLHIRLRVILFLLKYLIGRQYPNSLSPSQSPVLVAVQSTPLQSTPSIPRPPFLLWTPTSALVTDNFATGSLRGGVPTQTVDSGVFDDNDDGDNEFGRRSSAFHFPNRTLERLAPERLAFSIDSLLGIGTSSFSLLADASQQQRQQPEVDDEKGAFDEAVSSKSVIHSDPEYTTEATASSAYSCRHCNKVYASKSSIR